MNKKELSIYKNPYISIAKFIASCLIVLTHIKFFGPLGNLIDLAARTTVPFFFGIAGYFSYQTDNYKLPKRIKKLVIILLITDLIYFFWGLFYYTYTTGQNINEAVSSLVSIKKIALFFFIDMRTNCLTFHMWYITALIKVYAALFLYLVFTNNQKNYKPLYYTAIPAFFFFIAFGINALAAGTEFDIALTRNGLFFGFPLFMGGIFLHNYEQVIINRFHLTRIKLILLFITGFTLSLLELIGIGKTEMPVGFLLSVSSLILLLTGFPVHYSQNTRRCFFSSGDIETMSLVIYIIHPLVHYVSVTFGTFSGHLLYPLHVLSASILISILFCCIKKVFLPSKN